MVMLLTSCEIPKYRRPAKRLWRQEESTGTAAWPPEGSAQVLWSKDTWGSVEIVHVEAGETGTSRAVASAPIPQASEAAIVTYSRELAAWITIGGLHENDRGFVGVTIGSDIARNLSLPERYAQKASRLRAVKKVILVSAESGITIWTILDSEPGNSGLRYSIYDIEAEVLEEFPESRADFRLINLAEYEEPAQVHLPTGQVIYERE